MSSNDGASVRVIFARVELDIVIIGGLEAVGNIIDSENYRYRGKQNICSVGILVN